jgi:peptide/nickel transport system ATP-binding protein
MADEVMVMNEGEVVEIAGSDELYSKPRHPYTRQLLSAMPRGWRGAAARTG